MKNLKIIASQTIINHIACGHLILLEKTVAEKYKGAWKYQINFSC